MLLQSSASELPCALVLVFWAIVVSMAAWLAVGMILVSAGSEAGYKTRSMILFSLCVKTINSPWMSVASLVVFENALVLWIGNLFHRMNYTLANQRTAAAAGPFFPKT
jgi:hypothetical protein